VFKLNYFNSGKKKREQEEENDSYGGLDGATAIAVNFCGGFIHKHGPRPAMLMTIYDLVSRTYILVIN
jgi:hypothetical protein